MSVTQATADHGAQHHHVPLRVVGLLVAAAFFRSPTDGGVVRARAAVREQSAVSEVEVVVLVVLGPLGLGRVATIVDGVLASGVAVPVVVCGRTDRSCRQLAARSGFRALGWCDDMSEVMAAANVVVTSTGALMFAEVLIAELPAVCATPQPGTARPLPPSRAHLGWRHGRGRPPTSQLPLWPLPSPTVFPVGDRPALYRRRVRQGALSGSRPGGRTPRRPPGPSWGQRWICTSKGCNNRVRARVASMQATAPRTAGMVSR